MTYRDLDSHTIIVGDFNTSLSIWDRSTRQKINNNIQDLNSALDQADLIDIYRTLHFKSTECTFFLAPHRTYSTINHIIGSKSLFSICIAFHSLKWNIGYLFVIFFPYSFLSPLLSTINGMKEVFNTYF